MSDEVVQQAEWYEAYRNGLTLAEEEKKSICPSRGDVVELYRAAAAGLCAEDLRPVICRLGTQRAGKLLAAADVLQELGHLIRGTEADSMLYQSPEKVKRPLQESRILAGLEE